MYKIPTNLKNNGQCQLVRPLERILEEAHLSGELKLNNRKLKDFPKSATKFNLADTVTADLSRNKFSEWPEEITSFAFLESLLLYHNTIRNIPSSVIGLSSLSYLDLRSNQLINLPREICFLPLQVLLISNNRLILLPEELGRMEKLTDLDASCNQISNLPVRIGDLRNIRSLSLRSNHLVYFPREITLLTLISLDISNNKISSLPVEVRQMSTLVDLKLENNPLTFPPANLCVRGLVHVFKFLDTQANKTERGKNGGGSCGGSSFGSHDYSTLKRNSGRSVVNSNNIGHNIGIGSIDIHVDSIYSMKNGMGGRTLDKNAVLNSITKKETAQRKEFASQENFQIDTSLDYTNEKLQSTIISSLTASTSQNTSATSSTTVSPIHQHLFISENTNELFSPKKQLNNDEEFILDDPQKMGEKNKNFENIQTYKEYKEALKLQRNQEISNFYKNKIKKNSTSGNGGGGGGGGDYYEMNNKANNLTNGNIPDEIVPSIPAQINGNPLSPQQQIINGTIHKKPTPAITSELLFKKPVQKVIPQSQNDIGDDKQYNNDKSTILLDYLKPRSPIKPFIENHIRENSNIISNKITTSSTTTTTSTPPTSTTNSNFTTKIRRNVTWNEAIPSEKLSFTMRREFDRQKEETELLLKLRQIIETRLKMTLPDDISTALMDGVILCHLANIVRPRSVASIHVPSPGVPHLTMARCRRNVDNFLEACRKIGIDENLICCSADVLEGKQAVQVAITVGELFRLHSSGNISGGGGSQYLNDNIKSPMKVSRCNSSTT